MRVVICADAHLDSVFPIFNYDEKKLKLRQDEQRKAFLKVINEVKRIDAHMLLIPGDLFCADNVSEDTILFLKNAFSSIKNTFVMIAPGNNDPATANSPYITGKWPDNVYIFRKGLEALELSFDDTNETIRIYASGFRGHLCRNSLLRNNNTLPILDKNYINLLVMHGSLCQKGTRNDYNPIFIEDINACGFDFCALGHIHKFTNVTTLENSNYAYTGPCEGRNFREYGPCGVLSGSITKDCIDLNFVKTSVRENINVDVDISSVKNIDDIINEIKQKCTNTENIYNVKLVGHPMSNIKISPKNITKILASEYFYTKVTSAYKENIDLDILKQENSLRGCFVRSLENRFAGNQNSELMHDALIFGLKAFESEELLDENY